MEKYVFWLDITMNNIVVVHVLNCITNLLYYRSDLILRHRTAVFKIFVEIASPTQFHQKIEVVVLDESRVELHYVWVV